ncbi:MAG: hypothetical protein ABSH20_06870 [Tepidisphaeraceae bacterium]|jgi:hypothetical protein
MASMRQYILGNPPFRFLAGHLAQDKDFISDAQCILKIDEDAYCRLAAELGKSGAFLGHPALNAIAEEVLGKSEDARTIASIIYRVGGMLYDTDMSATEAMAALGKAIEEKADSLEPKDRRILTARLRALTAEPTGLAKQYKAQKLAEATNAELDKVQLICDIRPIFDQSRERIEGAIPLAMLRLEYSEADGDSEVVEVRITEKQIAELELLVVTAKRKLTLIKELLATQHVAVPATKATITEEEEDDVRL